MVSKIVLIGPPASGKGTQAEKICEHYSIPHISPGNLFRAMKNENTEIAREARKYMEQGKLVPDHITNDITLERIKKPDCEKGFLLDGFPRDIIQAKFLEENNIQITHCILVNVSDNECVKRIGSRRLCSKCKAEFNTIYLKPKQEGVCDKCGGELILRKDDSPKTAKQRLLVYHKQTEPVLKFYEDKKMLFKVDGEQPIEKVFENIKNALE